MECLRLSCNSRQGVQRVIEPKPRSGESHVSQEDVYLSVTVLTHWLGAAHGEGGIGTVMGCKEHQLDPWLSDIHRDGIQAELPNPVIHSITLSPAFNPWILKKGPTLSIPEKGQTLSMSEHYPPSVTLFWKKDKFLKMFSTTRMDPKFKLMKL